MYNESVTLIKESFDVNTKGDSDRVIAETPVFAKVKSIRQSEFYQAQSVGMKPEIQFEIADYLDYKNEQKLKYHPFNGEEETYQVIRTYRTGNALEIVCKRGVENGSS